MILEFDKSFLKSLNKVNDSGIPNRINEVISEIEKALNIKSNKEC